MKNITVKGKPLSLVGRAIAVGAGAPDFKVSAADLHEVTLADFKDKVKVITSFPSIDTPVCDLQVKEFNKKAAELSPDVAVIGISKDLPFAQQRFCEAHNITRVVVLSDFKTSSFGINYGLLIKELNLLARSVIIVDKQDVVRYVQVVEELTAAPDYGDALKNLEAVLQKPALPPKAAAASKCTPCEGGTPPLPKEKVDILLAQHRGWELVEGKKIVKAFTFKDFVEAKYFVDLVSVIAEEQGHHPTITIIYNKVKITLSTHSSGGLTDNDFIMAAIIDQLRVAE